MDITDLTKDLLNLADATPLTDVDIKPIVEKYSIGKDFNEQQKLRTEIERILIELRKNEEIFYVDSSIHISVSRAGIFSSWSGIIRSTYKRQKEKELD